MYNLLEEGKLNKSLKENLTKKPVSKPKSILKKGGQNPDESDCITDDEKDSGLNLNEISGIELDPDDSFNPDDSNFNYSFDLYGSVDNSTNSFNLNDSNNSPNNILNHPIMDFNDSNDNTGFTDCEESY